MEMSCARVSQSNPTSSGSVTRTRRYATRSNHSYATHKTAETYYKMRYLLPGYFSPAEIVVSRAPGRIDLMGGIADYSGSLVLQWPIAAATVVGLQLQDAPMIQICSLPANPEEAERSFEMSLSDQDY